MGIRAHLQKGRTKPGLVLPANAVEKVNAYKDKSTTEKWLGKGAKSDPNIKKEPAAPSKAVLNTSPADTTKTDVEAQDRANAAELQHASEQAEAAKQTTPDNLTEIDGVGEALEQNLYEAGFKTYEALMDADKAALAEISGISDDMAKEIVKQAKKLAKAKAKAAQQ